MDAKYLLKQAADCGSVITPLGRLCCVIRVRPVEHQWIANHSYTTRDYFLDGRPIKAIEFTRRLAAHPSHGETLEA